MTDLAEFLLARIGEDEEVAREAAEQNWAWRTQSGIVVTDRRTFPARVLAECEAKRRIVEPWTLRPADTTRYDSRTDEDGWRYGVHAEAHGVILRLLALPYAEHPDYREEWKP